jgi:lactate dehydrogenase-like 2-hydroxyacid dehydrogenase
MIAVQRGLREADAFVRRGVWTVAKGEWSNGNYPLGRSLRGRKVGVLGLGRIGSAVARRLSGFDVETAYSARHAHADTALRYFASPVALAEWSDILIVCCPGGPSTRHLVDRGVIEALGPDGIIVNVSRGSVVDEQALVEALASGRLGGVGLDVFEHEPDVPQALRDLPNVFVLPHIGTATEETRQAMGEAMVKALAKHLTTSR